MLQKSLLILLVLSLVGCDDGGNTRTEPIDTDTGTGVELNQDTGGSIAEWETDYDTDPAAIGDTDFSVACYPYRVFNYNNWLSGSGYGNSINKWDEVTGEAIVHSTTVKYGTFKTSHFDAYSDRFYGEHYPGSTFDTDSSLVNYYLVGFYGVKINDNSTIAGNGHEEIALSDSRAFYWKSDQVFKRIFTDEDGEQSYVTGLNNMDNIVGYHERTELPPVGVVVEGYFFEESDGSIAILPPLPGAAVGANAVEAMALNDSDQVVGHAQDASGDWKPFSWDPTLGYTTSATLGGSRGIARDINNNDEIVGQSEIGGVLKPTLWEASGAAVDLGLWPGMKEGVAVAINNHGDIVGYDTPEDSTMPVKAWLYTDDTKTALEDLYGPHTKHQFSAVADINDNGIIVGTANVRGVGPYAVGLIPRTCSTDTTQGL